MESNANAYLLTRSYVTGYAPSSDDAEILAALFANAKIDSAKFPYLARWQAHMNQFTEAERKAWPQGQGKDAVLKAMESSSSPKKSPKKEAAAPKKEEVEEEEEDDELFGDDDGTDDAEAIKALQEKLAKQKQDALDGKVNKNARSLIVLDVKPYDEDTDLEALCKAIKSIEHKGIQNWGAEHKFAEVAYGIKKLIVSVVVYDDLCGVDELTDLIMENHEDQVQSIDVAAMSKV